jgi:hypothetical protein
MSEPKMPDSGALILKNGLKPKTEIPKYTAEEIAAIIADIKTKAQTDEQITNEVIDAKVKLLQDKIDRGEIIVDTTITKNQATSPAEGATGLIGPIEPPIHPFRKYSSDKIKTHHNFVNPNSDLKDTK